MSSDDAPKSYIDDTPLPSRADNEVLVHDTQQTIDLGERDTTIPARSSCTMDFAAGIPAMDGLDAHAQLQSSLRY